LFSKLPQTGEFETVALPHLRELFRTAVRLLGDNAKAEDVVQETYFAGLEVNTIHHHRRSWFNLRRVRESEEILEQTAVSSAPVPERLEQAGKLDRLPADYRAAVLLSDVEEFSYKEIAGMLDVPKGTVMSRLSRGRKLLRDGNEVSA
jgi:RNA polymerase sigma-70 factor (ECF subfamily)